MPRIASMLARLSAGGQWVRQAKENRRTCCGSGRPVPTRFDFAPTAPGLDCPLISLTHRRHHRVHPVNVVSLFPTDGDLGPRRMLAQRPMKSSRQRIHRRDRKPTDAGFRGNIPAVSLPSSLNSAGQARHRIKGSWHHGIGGFPSDQSCTPKELHYIAVGTERTPCILGIEQRDWRNWS